MTVVLPLRMWSPENSRPSSTQEQAQVVGCVAGGVHHLQGMGDFALQRFGQKASAAHYFVAPGRA